MQVCEYELERDVYRASKLGFLELAECFPPARRPGRWSRFWTLVFEVIDRVVEEDREH